MTLRPTTNLSSRSFLVILTILCSILALVATALPAANPLKSTLDDTRFLFLANSQAGKEQILECPNHAYGSRAKGLVELNKRLAAQSQKNPFIQLCVFGQVESIRMYTDNVSWIGINSFASIDANEGPGQAPNTSPLPASNQKYWSNDAHPVLNRLTRLRRETPAKISILSRIDLSMKEPGVWEKRTPSQEELKWCAVALAGTGYSGVIWVGQSDNNKVLTNRIENYFQNIAPMMVANQPTALEVSSKNAYVSVMETTDKYILYILSPDYVSFHTSANSPRVSTTPTLPLDENLECSFTATIHGLSPDALKSGHTDLRQTTNWSLTSHENPSSEPATQVKAAFKGSSNIIILTKNISSESSPNSLPDPSLLKSSTKQSGDKR